jgi:predicted  nucleic acid-binding Zn-ribbon protein
MIEDKIKIKCSKCSTIFGERAERIRNGFQKQCPNCFKLITFDSSSEDANIRRALKLAREHRQVVADLKHAAAAKAGAVTS